MSLGNGSSVKLREDDDALFFYSEGEGFDHTHFTAGNGGAKIERYADKAKIVEGKAKAERFVYDQNDNSRPALPLEIAPNRSLSLQDSVEINAGADAVLVEPEYGEQENSANYVKVALSLAGGMSVAGGTVSAVVTAAAFDELTMKNGFSAVNVTVDKSSKLVNLDAGNNNIRLANNGTIQNAIKGANGAQISLAKAGAINDKSNIYDSVTGNVVTSLADGDMLTYDIARSGWVRTVPNRVTVNFDANGGLGYQAPVTILAGDAFILPANTYTRSGYIFGGWKIGNSGGLLLPGTPITVNADITLYAQWTPLQSNVTIGFNANGGSGSQSPAIIVAGSAFTLPANPYTRSGYIFGGWKIDDTGSLLLPGTSVIASADFTLYAQWTQIGSTVIIDFNANGGSGSQSPAIIVAGSAFTLPSSPYTRPGYIFGGWKIDNSGSILMPGASVVASADFTLYAQWAATGGGGGGSRSSGSSKQDGAKPAPNPWLEPDPAQSLTSDAGQGQQDSVRTKSTDTYGVRKASWQKLKGYRYYHDTMDAGSVGLRLYVDNPAAIMRDMYVTGFVKGSFADNRKAMLEKWFNNKIRVIHMDEAEPWGQEVRIAAKIDLDKMDTENLYFYSYDKKTNKYTRIKEPKYRIDKNGYLHFYTWLAGDIIVSDGALEKK